MRSLYVVEWKDDSPGMQWREFHVTYSLKDARAAAQQAQRALAHATGLKVRLLRWVRPKTTGTHGWLWEGKVPR